MLIKKSLILLPFLIFQFLPTYSQERNVVDQSQFWVGYSLSKKMDKDWTVRFSTENRRFFQSSRDHMFYALMDATYKLDHHWSLTGGLMYFYVALPSDPDVPVAVRQPEYRPYQRVSYGFSTGAKSSLSLAVTLEERIRMRLQDGQQTDDYFTYVRFRNKAQFKYQLPNLMQKPLSFYVYDEYVIHLGNAVKGNPFDQNRFSMGVEWKALPKVAFKVGYLNWYQEIAHSTTAFSRNILTFSVAQTL